MSPDQISLLDSNVATEADIDKVFEILSDGLRATTLSSGDTAGEDLVADAVNEMKEGLFTDKYHCLTVRESGGESDIRGALIFDKAGLLSWSINQVEPKNMFYHVQIRTNPSLSQDMLTKMRETGWEVQGLGVDDKFRGQGAGALLVSSFAELAREAKRSAVVVTNIPCSYAFYHKQFVHLSTHDIRYDPKTSENDPIDSYGEYFGLPTDLKDLGTAT